MTEPLSSRNLARHGMRRGAYDGDRRRRFVLFHPAADPQNVSRSEFDTKRERDEFALKLLDERAEAAAREAVAKLGHISVRFYPGLPPIVGVKATTFAALKRLAASGEFRFEAFETEDGDLRGWFMSAAAFALPAWAARRAELPK
jgi:hypothetical protein